MSNHNQEELKAILKKYLYNEASVEERNAVDTWYQALGSANETVPVLNDPVSKEKLAGNIKTYLKGQITEQKQHWFKHAYIKYAAACLLILGTGIGGYTYVFQQKESLRKEIVILSGNNAQKQLSLPDGSKVLLNVSSKLIIPKDFGKGSRHVTLIGEAFFDVAKDKSKSFIIHSGALKTKVLGTTFNINAYPDLEKIKIAVLSGKVKISGTINGHEQILAAGMVKKETLSFYKDKQTAELKTEDPELITSWRNNKLFIDNATLGDIARQLERHYHIKVVYNGPQNLKDRYTIRFNNESMNGVLKILSMLTKRKLTYQNNQITIK